jgi:hypothetical protein
LKNFSLLDIVFGGCGKFLVEGVMLMDFIEWLFSKIFGEEPENAE